MMASEIKPSFLIDNRVTSLAQMGVSHTQSSFFPFPCFRRENNHAQLKRVSVLLNQAIKDIKSEREDQSKLQNLLENIKYFNESLELYNKIWSVRLFFATIKLVSAEVVERKIVSIESPKDASNYRTSSDLIKSLPEEENNEILKDMMQIYQCSFCLEVNDTAVFVEPCGHEFHELCMAEILKNRQFCPICNLKMSGYKVALTTRAAVEELMRKRLKFSSSSGSLSHSSISN